MKMYRVVPQPKRQNVAPVVYLVSSSCVQYYMNLVYSLVTVKKMMQYWLGSSGTGTGLLTTIV